MVASQVRRKGSARLSRQVRGGASVNIELACDVIVGGIVEKVRYLIIGAGISGLSFANFIDDEDYLILERDAEIGGYCKTVVQDGFVWDYSGHFFHFRHPDIERYLVERMPPDEVATVAKVARILYKDRLVDFPFQKNIHQLPQDDFIDCLHELYFRPSLDGPPAHFEEMLISRFGRGIAERFLIPYNEKLYACPMRELDASAMGRFFPDADMDAIIANFKRPDNASYNATFTYPRRGAIQYVNALASEVPSERLSLGEGLESVDLKRKVATTTSGRQIAFEALISSAPFNQLMAMTGLPHSHQTFSSNKVAVFNLGFDAKGWSDVHWVYFPERQYSFYRVGFYDNILGTDRMSLYVEIGMRTEDPVDVEALRAEVLRDLSAAGVVTDQALVSWHHVTLDPAYVHITGPAMAEYARLRDMLVARGVYSVGRYGGWTYCSIEDNILETRDLARMFNALDALNPAATS